MTNSDTSAYTETNKTTNIFPFSNFLKSKIFFFESYSVNCCQWWPTRKNPRAVKNKTDAFVSKYGIMCVSRISGQESLCCMELLANLE